MADVTVKRVEEMDSLFDGMFVRARASLGASSFGMQIINLPPGWTGYPEHDHAGHPADDLQEEIYTALEGTATLSAGGGEYRLEPGVWVRVGPAEKRKIVTDAEPVRLLCLGGVPGHAYAPPPYTEVGAPPPSM